MGNTGITQEEVFQAADRLTAAGEEVTIKAIREELGTGSLTTITRHLRAWKGPREKPAPQSLDALKLVGPEILGDFLKNEHPQIIAIVVSHLPPEHAAEVLRLLPKSVSVTVIDRLSMMTFVSPRMLGVLNAALHREFSAIEQNQELSKGGMGAISGIWKHLDSQLRESIITGIKKQNPKLAHELEAPRREER